MDMLNAGRLRHLTLIRGLCGNRREGQGLVEYGLVILLVSIAMYGSVEALGFDMGDLYQQIVTGLPF